MLSTTRPNDASISSHASLYRINQPMAQFMLLQAAGSSINTVPMPELAKMKESMLADLVAPSAYLTEIIQYYAKMPSKQLRAKVIFLFAKAANGVGSQWQKKLEEGKGEAEIEESSSDSHKPVLPTQIRFAELVEIIHAASLFHDDVLDNSPTRRGEKSAPAKYGNKTSILAGDFLLGKTLELTTNLNDKEVALSVAGVLMDMVNGEIIQAQTIEEATAREAQDIKVDQKMPNEQDGENTKAHLWVDYLKKTYAKTASLFSLALVCTAILGGAAKEDSLREIATTYGTELGMAFQILDDVLDYEGANVGKPSDGADLKLGLVTAPVLFAWDETPEMTEFIQRRFSGEEDVAKTMRFVKNSKALLRTKALASLYAQRARDTLAPLPASPAKRALEKLAEGMMLRK